MIWFKGKDKIADRNTAFKEKILDVIRGTEYELEDFLIDDKNFGNIIINLRHDEILLRFIQDRDFSWSEFGIKDFSEAWLDFNTLLKVMGIKTEEFSHELFEVLKLTIGYENKHHDELSKLKDKEMFNKMKKDILLLQRSKSPFWNGEIE